MSSTVRRADHLQQESSKSVQPPFPQYTMLQLLSCNPLYLPHSFPSKSSLSFKVRAGKLCLTGTARNQVFLREKTVTFTIYLAGPQCTKQKISLHSSSRFFFLPVWLLKWAYEIRVPCCTCTIHKGYYIVLHSSPPILQLILFYIQPLFHSKNKNKKINLFFSTGVQKQHFYG